MRIKRKNKGIVSTTVPTLPLIQPEVSLLSPNHQSTTTTTTTTTTRNIGISTTTTSMLPKPTTTSAGKQSSSSDNGATQTTFGLMNTSAIIGGIIGAVGAILLVVFLVVIICFIKNRKRPERRLTKSTSIENEYYQEFPSTEVQFPGDYPPDLTYSNETPAVGSNESNTYEEINTNQTCPTLDSNRVYLEVIADDRNSVDQFETGASDDQNNTYDNFAGVGVAQNNTASDVINSDTVIVDNDLYGRN